MPVMHGVYLDSTASLRGRLLRVFPGLWLVMGVAGSTTEQASSRTDIDALVARDICVTRHPDPVSSTIKPDGER